MICKRLFDVFFAFVAIVVLLVPLLILAVVIVTGSRGGVFYLQKRVGRHEKIFRLIKFRTMHTGSDSKGLLTVGANDNRITGAGKWLRKYKLDELPQLFNILSGDMSVVGPRPEVPKYTALYTEEQRKVFAVRPGLTDYASLQYIDESELLASQDDPEKYYIETVMPAKLKLNIQYLNEMSFMTDLKLIFRTLGSILGK